MSTTARQGRLDPDRLAELEEQRDHLLASLRDLESEHDAGDLDDHDYGELKDDYTARAAEVIRAIDEHRDLLEQSRPERNRGRTALVVVSVLAVAVLAGFLLARSSGQRGSGTITGNDDTLRQRLASCQMTSFQKPAEGVDCYADILDEHPDNLEALTYQGWAFVRDDQVERGAKNLARVVEIDPDYPDARVFRAVLLARAGTAARAKGDDATARQSYTAAAAEVDRFYRNDPPEVAVQVLRQEGLERTIFFGLLDDRVRGCWEQAAAAGGAAGSDTDTDTDSDSGSGSGSEGSAVDDAAFIAALSTCLDGVLAADPTSTDALLSKALTLLGTETPDVAAATTLAERILAVEPDNGNALLLLASAAVYRDDLDGATALLDRVDGLPRPTGAALIGSPEDLRSMIERRRSGGSSGPGGATTTTTEPRATASTVPGAPRIPNADGG